MKVPSTAYPSKQTSVPRRKVGRIGSVEASPPITEYLEVQRSSEVLSKDAYIEVYTYSIQEAWMSRKESWPILSKYIKDSQKPVIDYAAMKPGGI
jgi:hypothetical protein